MDRVVNNSFTGKNIYKLRGVFITQNKSMGRLLIYQ